MAKIDSANRTVRLSSAFISQERGQNLCASFVEMNASSENEFFVRFPSHSFTHHERTLINVIAATMTFGEDPYKPHEPHFEVIFSIPHFPKGYIRDYKFEQWYLVSIKPSEAKKEPPNDAGKAQPRVKEGPILVGHRGMRLVSVRLSDGRPHDLLAKFVGVGSDQGKELELSLGTPAQSTDDQTTADVAHTRTILNAITSSVSQPPLPNTRSDDTQWREPLFRVIFSIPQDTHGHVTDFTDWSIVSISEGKGDATRVLFRDGAAYRIYREDTYAPAAPAEGDASGGTNTRPNRP